MRNCPSVVILANSREGLAIGAESVYRLPSLSLPNPKEPQTTESLAQFESVQLFVERAVQVQRAFAVTDQNAPALASVCQRLDGIPLAIELAAARLRSLSVEEINGKLDQRFRLLTGGSRTALPRQQTLRSLIDWSFDLLNESEKALLRRLAVFAGGWTLESAEQVCADEPVEELSMLDLITSLCDKNLVVAEQADEPTRYGMLETIRQYARDRLLESGEGKEMRDRHLAYFLALAEEAEPQLIGPGQLEWLARLEIELDNLRATLTWSSTFGGNIEAGLRISGAISRFWNLHCHQNEGLGWLDCFLTQDSNWQTAAARSKALHAAGVLAYELRDYPRAKALLDESLVSHCDLGDQRGIAKSLNGLGNVAMEEGDYPAARTLHEQSLVIRSELDDRTGVATSLNNLGVVALWSGDFAAADTFAKGSLLISRELGVKGLIASSLATIGEVAQEQRDFPTAGSAYRQSLGIFRKLGDNRLVAYLLVHLASVHSALADPDRAAHLYGAVERVRELNKWPLSPRDRSEFEQQVAAARTSLGDDVAFDRAWQEGRNVTLGQAIELALATSAEGV